MGNATTRTSVIKFWGPHEIGDPESPISLLFWGPLCQIRDPPLKHAHAFRTILNSCHSELTSHEEGGLHQSAHLSIGFRWLLHRMAALLMSALAVTMNKSMLRTTRMKRDSPSAKSTSSYLFNMVPIQATLKGSEEDHQCGLSSPGTLIVVMLHY